MVSADLSLHGDHGNNIAFVYIQKDGQTDRHNTVNAQEDATAINSNVRKLAQLQFSLGG